MRRQLRYDIPMAIYHAIGEMETCRRLAVAFYARVENDKVLRPLYPRSLHCAVESIALFLAQYFGGPREYSGRPTSLSLYEAHLRFQIGQAARDAWLNGRAINCRKREVAEFLRARSAG